MCLTIDKKATAKAKLRKRPVTRFKCVRLCAIFGGMITSSIHEGFVWQPGWNHAKGRRVKELRTELNAGAVHVYVDSADAERERKRGGDGSGLVVMKVRCHPEDLVAVGTFGAISFRGVKNEAYLAVHLNEKEYQRVGGVYIKKTPKPK